MATGTELRTLNGHQNSVSSVSFSPDGKLLVSGSADSAIKLWDVATGSELKTFNGRQMGVLNIISTPVTKP